MLCLSVFVSFIFHFPLFPFLHALHKMCLLLSLFWKRFISLTLRTFLFRFISLVYIAWSCCQTTVLLCYIHFCNVFLCFLFALCIFFVNFRKVKMHFCLFFLALVSVKHYNIFVHDWSYVYSSNSPSLSSSLALCCSFSPFSSLSLSLSLLQQLSAFTVFKRLFCVCSHYFTM